MRASASTLAPLLLSLAACMTPPAARSAKGGANGAPTGGEGSGLGGKSDLMIFLLIGQSNMAGAPPPAAADLVEDPRVKVLAYQDCANLGRRYDQWYPARPPLHGCNGGVGPGDYLGKALADAYPDATIGLVPLAIPGVDIDFFSKGVISTRRHEFMIPPDDHWAGAYDWVLERARLAQQAGTIRGIAFHQGESDTGRPEWVGKVAAMVDALRTDLALGEVPFVVGELLYSGCCGAAHNPLIALLPQAISNTRVVSAQGLSGQDEAHFDLAGQRELGKRYGAAMIELLQAPASGQHARRLGSAARALDEIGDALHHDVVDRARVVFAQHEVGGVDEPGVAVTPEVLHILPDLALHRCPTAVGRRNVSLVDDGTDIVFGSAADHGDAVGAGQLPPRAAHGKRADDLVR